MSTFMFFKETLGGNAKKLAHLGQFPAFEYGLHSQQQLNLLKPQSASVEGAGGGSSNVFDKYIMEKLLILYSPDRTSSNNFFHNSSL